MPTDLSFHPPNQLLNMETLTVNTSDRAAVRKVVDLAAECQLASLDDHIPISDMVCDVRDYLAQQINGRDVSVQELLRLMDEQDVWAPQSHGRALFVRHLVLQCSEPK